MSMKKWIVALLALCLVAIGAASMAEGLESGDAFCPPVEAAAQEAGEVALEGPQAEEALPMAVQAAGDDDELIDIYKRFSSQYFREYIMKNIDLDGDLMLSRAEREAVEEINIPAGVSERYSPTDLWLFPNLKKLDCSSKYGSQIDALDLSQNAKLEYLDCTGNTMASLDLSHNKALKTLIIGNVSDLSVRDLPLLEELTVNGMDPLDLDVSGCVSLKRLSAHYQLKTLNARGCASLELLCHTGYDPEKYLFGSWLTRLDLTGCSSLKALEIHTTKSDGLTLFSVAGCSSLESLNCTECGLTALDLSGCTALKELNCDQNAIAKLNVRDCAALETLRCYSNQLKTLDVSGNGNLKLLNCDSNQLSKLDFSANPKLETLLCGINALKALDLSGHRKLKTASCGNCNLKTVDVSGCTALTYLNVWENALTQLDVSTCKALEQLRCSDNKLKTLDISKNRALWNVNCADNPLKALDITQCEKLLWLVNNHKLLQAASYSSYSKMVDDQYYFLHYDTDVELITEHIRLSGAKVTADDRVYNGKARKPAVTVTLDGEALVKGKDYTVEYINNTEIGKATVKVRGAGKYVGTAKGTFRINPRKVTGLTLTAGTKKLTASWTKAAGVTGFQIQYSLKSDFSTAKRLTVEKASATKKAVTGLAAGKTYYMRVRAYKTVNGKKYWSEWSKAVKKKTK